MISIIIPTFNEEKALPATLRRVRETEGNYEIIVVDGGSQDQTQALVRANAHLRLLTARKGRASQMNAGAAAARGEWLLFLHADTLLPEGVLKQLHEFEGDPSIQAGGFLHQFSGHDWRLRLISWLDNVRCRRTRIMYGDQAMFVRRGLFQQLGGFPDQPILEDVAFGERLVRIARPVLLSPPVMTDPRKFVSMGVWRSLARVIL
ncbi:MAG TPA: TIGR04283 family arsenosugar biosynthesis glycosyltransferase, partial [Nitrospiraceae bacterium]|nr:TIGR04283 family arsenosugar biosynthesis glycosyltransferase [Nitrospiraceae bacterium]